MKKFLYTLLIVLYLIADSHSQSWQSINSSGGASGIIQNKQIHFSMGQALSGQTSNAIQTQQGFQYLYWKSNVAVQDMRSMDITIYPNPASDILNIKSESIINGRLDLHSMSGQLIKSIVVNSNVNQVTVDYLQKGTYLFSIIQDQFIYKKIIIIQ